MRVKVALTAWVIALGALGFLLGGTVASGAPAHRSCCHGAHTCPSDHHTYVWTDLTTGLAWDCAEPGASEYEPSRDTTVIVYQGLTYYCRPASGATTTAPTSTTTTATETSSTSTTTTSTS